MRSSMATNDAKYNRPFAQLLPGLETGHPVTVGQSPAYDFSVSDEQKGVFLVSVSDCSECDSYAGDWLTVTGCPVSNPGNNCANSLLDGHPGPRTSSLHCRRTKVTFVACNLGCLFSFFLLFYMRCNHQHHIVVLGPFPKTDRTTEW